MSVKNPAGAGFFDVHRVTPPVLYRVNIAEHLSGRILEEGLLGILSRLNNIARESHIFRALWRTGADTHLELTLGQYSPVALHKTLCFGRGFFV